MTTGTRFLAQLKRSLRGRWRQFECNRLLSASPTELSRVLWGHRAPADGWDTWDPAPWQHPWLTSSNLAAMRDYSRTCRDRWLSEAAALPERPCRYAFVGNLANNMYMRARPLRRAGHDIDIYLHPHDYYLMSYPAWEEFDGVLDTDVADIRLLREAGLNLPHVDGVEQPETTESFNAARAFELFPNLAPRDVMRWLPYLSGHAWLPQLAQYDALLCAQTTYLGLLAGRPYVAAHVGGDIWYECSRADLVGRLQRAAYHGAVATLASNPWSFAHARRYGMHNLVYLPLLLDESFYSPGDSALRAQWEAQSGGNFFVFSAVRQNDRVKGTMTGLEGFARFAVNHPGARLVFVEWGQETSKNTERLSQLGIADRVIRLRVAGKRRVVEYLRAADCVLDQFTIGYYGATALEAMACEVPVLMRIEKAQYDALCDGGAPPVLNADSSAQVADSLSRLAANDAGRRQLGRDARAWFVRNHGASAWGPTLMALLRLAAEGRRFSYADSPLHAGLGEDERAYHARGLAAAPDFPHYQ